MPRRLAFIGALGTLAYIAICAWFMHGAWGEIQALTPNEVGDLMAGIAGPLALGWLVLGFFQQGAELRQSTRALELQAAELKASVEHQAQLVEASRAQVAAQMDSLASQRKRDQAANRPLLHINGTGSTVRDGAPVQQHDIKNVGPTAIDLKISISTGSLSISPSAFASLRDGDVARIYIHGQLAPDEAEPVLSIESQGLLGGHYLDRFLCTRGGGIHKHKLVMTPIPVDEELS